MLHATCITIYWLNQQMKFYHVIMCHYIILLYVLQFIVNTEVVTVSILNENIQFVVY